MDLHGTARECYTIAQEHGFWDDVKEGAPISSQKVSEKLMLVVDEVAEAHEEVRKGRLYDVIHYEGAKPCGLPIELADAVIRIFDLAMALDINIEQAISEKMEYNRTRPHKHGKQF